MADRELRVLRPGRRRPARHDPDPYGGVELPVALAYLSSEPVVRVRLSDFEALQLAAQLVGAVTAGGDHA